MGHVRRTLQGPQHGLVAVGERVVVATEPSAVFAMMQQVVALS